MLKDEESARDNHVLARNFAKYSPNLKSFFTRRLSNKPFLSCLTTPPHLKYAATLCNLSLWTCFADIDVSQGNVATYAKCGGIFNIHRTANVLRNLAVIFFKSVKIWQNYGNESAAPLFGSPCIFS